MPKVKKLSEEEIIAKGLVNALKDCKEDFTPEPTIQYEVGQKVHWGNHSEVTITEVLDGGKIYKVHSKKEDCNYGNPIIVENDTYVTWVNLHPINKDEGRVPIMSYREDFHLNFYQCDISSILCYYYGFGIDMNPDYQRGDVWTMGDKVDLIDSIFNNVEIGKFVLINLPYKADSPAYEVLDGKQRITALTEYYENKLPYKGRTFYEVNIRDRYHFLGYSISFSRTERPMTQEQKYRYFLKLNVGGKAQDPAHLEYVKNLHKRSLKDVQKEGRAKG